MPPRSRSEDVAPPATGWELVIKIGALVAFAIFIACLAVPLVPRIADYRALDESGRVLEAERAALQAELDRKEAELKLLDHDPLFVELKARDHLDMCQEGEVVFRFEEEGAN
jgi:cell division protein FtsB